MALIRYTPSSQNPPTGTAVMAASAIAPTMTPAANGYQAAPRLDGALHVNHRVDTKPRQLPGAAWMGSLPSTSAARVLFPCSLSRMAHMMYARSIASPWSDSPP